MFTERVQSRANQAGATQLRVLRSAENSFQQVGYGATTIRKIAADADVSVGTVMAVGDKDSLLLAVFDSWIEAVHSGRMATEPRKSSGSATNDILLLVDPFLDYFAKGRDLARHYAAIIVRGSHKTPIFQELATSLVSEITEVLHQAGFVIDDASRRADIIYLSYIGLLMTISNGAIDEEAAIDRLGDVINVIASTEGTVT